MVRLRLAVKKDGALCFLSHLDFARTVRYVIIRAHLPICYSEGFNPHMKLSFASALGVGVAADCEYMDMELEREIPVPEVIAAMNNMAPHGFAVLDGAYVDVKGPKLMAMANYAVYTLKGPVTEAVDDEAVQQSLAAFNKAHDVTYEKVSPKDRRKTRIINVKDHIIENVTGRAVGSDIELTVGIYQTGDGAIKPIQLWQVLCQQFGLPVHPDMMLARRIVVYKRSDGVNYSLF